MQKVRTLKGRRAEDSRWIELRIEGERIADVVVGDACGGDACFEGVHLEGVHPEDVHPEDVHLEGVRPDDAPLEHARLEDARPGHLPGNARDAEALGLGDRDARASDTHAGDLYDQGPWILPGLLDMQINGYAGQDINADDVTWETIVKMVRAVWATGVPLVCPTVITGSRERMSRSIAAILEACRRDPLVDRAVVGIHIEGPYISPADGPRGAHPPHHVRPPDWEEFESWMRLSEGRIRVVTLAPETEGAIDFIRRAKAAGVTVAIGHTEANAAQIREAIAAGASLSTHLGNGSHAVLPRLENYIWEQLAADELAASIIVDGHHLPPAVVKCIYRVKGAGRLALISDASPIAGLPPGRYPGFYGEVELLPNGRIQMVGSPYLAGSGFNLLGVVERMCEFTGVGLAEAAAMASIGPQRLLGLQGKAGPVAPGSPATLTIVARQGARLVPRATILAGQVVWKGAWETE